MVIHKELYFFRFIGCISILIFHIHPDAALIGWSRVDLFFVISGFLINNVCMNNYHVDKFLPKFYIRRLLRTWPAYFVLLELVFGYRWISGEATSINEMVSYSTFCQTIPLYGSTPAKEQDLLLAHTWCIAIEEQFYLIWPLLVILIGRNKLLAPLLVIIVLSPLARVFGAHPWTLLGRSDGLAMGALLSILVKRRQPMTKQKMSLLLFLALATTLILVFYIGVDQRDLKHGNSNILTARGSLRLLLVNLCYMLIIYTSLINSGGKFTSVVNSGFFRSFGNISYGMYLFSYPIILTCDGDAPKVLALSFAAAIASWFVVERPILQIRKKFRY